MKIDWKYFATTPGYKSLKAAYIKDVQKAATEKCLNYDDNFSHWKDRVK